MLFKLNYLKVIGLFLVIGYSSASYAGPFLLWGTENLNNLKVPTLQAIDDKVLRDIYSGASSIVLFIRNATAKLNYENFPKLSEIIGNSEWLYLPQEVLSSDPLEFNVNAEVFTLTGPIEQQDVEIAALYRDAQINYGQKNILGILATRNDNTEHNIYKREAVTESTSTTEQPTTLSPDEPTDNLIYLARGKGILYTTEVPILKIGANKSGDEIEYALKTHTIVTADERENLFKLAIKFIVPDKIIALKFRFQISGGSWTLNEVEYEDTKSVILDIVGEAPSAPLSFSYICGKTFVFRKGQISLTLKNIQVQPLLESETKFSKAYDCVGFMTPAILSGIFVTFLLAIGLTIGLTAILDIKPPNKFESRNSKQLTFTVQE